MPTSRSTKQTKRSSTKKKAARKQKKHRSGITAFLKDHGSKLRVAADAMTLAVAAEKLIELTVKFWQNLPFGDGVTMPREYHFLEARVPSDNGYPDELDSHDPITKGPDSINWVLAKKIYLDAQSIKSRVESGASKALLEPDLSTLDADKKLLIESVQPGLREMLIEKIESTEANLKPGG